MIGNDIHRLAKRLWPINRSLTGEGVRETLEIIRKILPSMKIHSVESGKKVFDWIVPKEWHVNEAYILTPSGEKICDFSKNNLHLVGYSSPFKGELSLEELEKNLYSLPKKPNAIPFITSYYEKRWGFCLSHNERKKLTKGIYKVVINSTLFDGYLNYGELIIPGETSDEIFLSSNICHPSMANNELSGPTVLTYLNKWLLSESNLRYTYRSIFIPETIGAIVYLDKHHKHLKKNVIGGFAIACIGDERSYSFTPSRNGNTLSDKIAQHVLSHIDSSYLTYSWLERGGDERQYCAPGIDLPISVIMRTKADEYPEYHTSQDDLTNVVTPNGLNGGYWALRKAISIFENNCLYNVLTLCEPQMSSRGLYPTLSVGKNKENIRLMMDFISYCDGKNDIITISDILGVPAWDLFEIIDKLTFHKIIKIEAVNRIF